MTMNSAVDQEEPMLTAAEVAERARIKRRTVYRLIAAGRLPAARVGGQWRVPLRACRALLAARVQVNAPDGDSVTGAIVSLRGGEVR